MLGEQSEGPRGWRRSGELGTFSRCKKRICEPCRKSGFVLYDETGQPCVTFGYLSHDEARLARQYVMAALIGAETVRGLR